MNLNYFGKEWLLASLVNEPTGQFTPALLPTMSITSKLALASVLFASLSSGQQPDRVKLTRAFAGLVTDRPIAVVIPDDGSQRQFLALQRGKILILPKEDASAEAKTFLDFTTREMEAKDGLFEEGINGLAFHPKFRENGLFYLSYTQQKPKRKVISELKVSGSDPDKADMASERVLLEMPLVNWNHHGGNIVFGKDGFLYIGTGDNSKRNDELRMANNNASLNGKILRIDVNSREFRHAYGIPADNPYANGVNAQPQIYASGIRNPWGLSFDEKGRLWCADVGQDLWEEINWIQNGGNYGWSFREGARQFPLRTDAAPEGVKFIDPIFEYNHGEGLSITGGFVYRGARFPERKGAYIYGDFVIGKIWALKVSDEGKVLSNELLYTSPQTPPSDPKKKPAVLIKPTAFCEDAQGEILVLDWNGTVQRVVN
jgi:quinoprotein glucose dehydrogenase